MTSNGQNKATRSNLLVNCPLVNKSSWLKFLAIIGLKQKKKKESQSYEHIRLSETFHTSYNILNYLNFILKECATSTHAKFKKRFSKTKLTRVGKGYLRF